MQLKRLKLRFRRNYRQRKKQVEQIGTEAERQLEWNFFRRFSHLSRVKGFVTAWLGIVLLLGAGLIIQTRNLSSYYQTLKPVPGGIYSEGIVGAYTNANPIYASSEVDSAVSRLIFAGLLTYSQHNQLVGDLADSWSVSPDGEVYTVHLRPNLKWQDGQPLTANDVAFTFHVIQNPDAGSPLNSSWQNVTITATNSQTVVFTLPNPLSSFPYSLTTGIIPQHILGNVPMDEMRSVAFDTTHPVGAGPFEYDGIEVNGNTPQTEEEQIELSPYVNYQGGKPKLNSFTVHAFGSEAQMIESFKKQDINAMAGLTSVPSDIASESSTHIYSMPVTAATMVFFKTSSGILSDQNVRQALVYGANTKSILSSLGYEVKPVTEPLLNGQLGFDSAYGQYQYDPGKADQILSADGWELGADGLRYNKQGQQLSFDLFAENGSDQARVLQQLQQEWRSIGVVTHLYLQDSNDFQATLAYHNYDALLYSISIGVDPDVFVYWDSTQASPQSPSQLNFSEWSNVDADAALEAGRTRTNPEERAIKYQLFLQAWQQAAPALALYQPRFLYVTHGAVYGISNRTINEDSDRYDNVQNWMINFAPITDQN